MPLAALIYYTFGVARQGYAGLHGNVAYVEGTPVVGLRSNLWGDDTPYFDRCAAGLGMKETEGRLQIVREGKCPSRAPGGQPVAWERAQLAQCKRQPIEPTR